MLRNSRQRRWSKRRAAITTNTASPTGQQLVGGRVQVWSRLVEEACEVTVQDDGPGMAPETLERVFDPYFTTKPTGTGLGLPITRGIVEEHGGRIDLQSELGGGCRVVIRLPLETKVS